MTGRDGEDGAIYWTVDPSTEELTSAIAFSDPGAIRRARKFFEQGGAFDTAKVDAQFIEQKINEERSPVHTELSVTKQYVWPSEGLTRVPDWVYTDQEIYEREIKKIFHGRTWNFVALASEIRTLATSSVRMSARPRSWCPEPTMARSMSSKTAVCIAQPSSAAN